jgi:hypothetical protein
MSATIYKDIIMSVLSSFIARHLVPTLESALLTHAPEAQAAILEEISALAEQVGAWLSTKLSQKKDEQ